MAKGVDAINLGFAQNTSAYVLYIPEGKTLITLNQVQFNEHEFPFRKRKMVEQYLSDNSTDIFFNQLQMSNGSIMTKLVMWLFFKLILKKTHLLEY